MQPTTPTLNTEPPQAGVGERDAKIAVAYMTMPENPTVTLSVLFERILAAGLRRNSIPVVLAVPFFRPVFTVAVLTVPREHRGAALESVKRTLTELNMLEESTIAVDRAGNSWFTVHGIGENGIKFEEAFMREEFLNKSLVAFEKHETDRRAIWAAAREEYERRARENGENP